MNTMIGDFLAQSGINVKDKLTENFIIDEVFRSQRALQNNILNLPSPTMLWMVLENARLLAVNLLQPIRELIGVTAVNSWYRCDVLNKLVNGSINSQHLRGMAADIWFPNNSLRGCYDRIIKADLDFDQLLLEGRNGNPPSWIHASYSESGNRNMTMELEV